MRRCAVACVPLSIGLWWQSNRKTKSEKKTSKEEKTYDRIYNSLEALEARKGRKGLDSWLVIVTLVQQPSGFKVMVCVVAEQSFSALTQGCHLGKGGGPWTSGALWGLGRSS